MLNDLSLSLTRYIQSILGIPFMGFLCLYRECAWFIQASQVK